MAKQISPDDFASDIDKAWFSEHPGETIRYRDRMPGEIPLETDQSFDKVFVLLVAPGVRRRQLYKGCIKHERKSDL